MHSGIELEFGGKPKFPEKNRSGQKREPTTNSNYMWRGSGNRTRDKLVEGERSHYCAITAPPNINQSMIRYHEIIKKITRFWLSESIAGVTTVQILDNVWLKNNMNFSKPMISRKMMTRVLCRNFRKSSFRIGQKDLPALQFLHANIFRFILLIYLAEASWKTHSCKFIPNWTRKTGWLPILATLYCKLKLRLWSILSQKKLLYSNCNSDLKLWNYEWSSQLYTT